MDEIKRFLESMSISEDDAMLALLAAFSPIQASALRQNWMRSKHFGNTAPTTKQIWSKFTDSGFQCSRCGSQYRITLDHKDNNPRNHDDDNLAVLCFACNRGRSAKATRDLNHQLSIYRAIISHIDLKGEFPSNKEILETAHVEQIGGSTYMVKWLKSKLLRKR